MEWLKMCSWWSNTDLPNQDPIICVLAAQAACPARLALASIMNLVLNRSRNMTTLIGKTRWCLEELHISTNSFYIFPTSFGFKIPSWCCLLRLTQGQKMIARWLPPTITRFKKQTLVALSRIDSKRMVGFQRFWPSIFTSTAANCIHLRTHCWNLFHPALPFTPFLSLWPTNNKKW